MVQIFIGDYWSVLGRLYIDCLAVANEIGESAGMPAEQLCRFDGIKKNHLRLQGY